MSDIIDSEKIQKIIYYAHEAKKSYQESLRQKKISRQFLHKACQLILNDEERKSNDFKNITNELLNFTSKED